MKIQRVSHEFRLFGLPKNCNDGILENFRIDTHPLTADN